MPDDMFHYIVYTLILVLCFFGIESDALWKKRKTSLFRRAKMRRRGTLRYRYSGMRESIDVRYANSELGYAIALPEAIDYTHQDTVDKIEILRIEIRLVNDTTGRILHRLMHMEFSEYLFPEDRQEDSGLFQSATEKKGIHRIDKRSLCLYIVPVDASRRLVIIQHAADDVYTALASACLSTMLPYGTGKGFEA